MTRRPATPTTRARRARLASLPALALSATLLGACAGTADLGDTDPLVDEVYQAIRLDPQLGASQVTVRHQGDGVVQLNGFIEDMIDEQSIIDAAISVDGVRRVDSNLTTSPG